MLILILLAGDYNPQRLIEQTKMGLAGYDPEEPDMRGIFMAKGPGKLYFSTLPRGFFVNTIPGIRYWIL